MKLHYLYSSVVLVAAAFATSSAWAAPTAAEQAYIKASNTDPQDEFGGAAISGDTMVVGAPYEDSTATGVNGPPPGQTYYRVTQQ